MCSRLAATGVLAMFVVLVAAGARAAHAEPAYPTRPIRIVIGFGPGGLADITFRLVGQKLSERTGQQVVIENRPSAGGVVAASAVTTAAPDGYTLFVLSSGIAISRSLLKAMPFDPVTAFTPISTVAYFDLLLLVRADSPLHTLGDLLAAARADPARLNIGTINPGSTQNLTAELFRAATGLPMTLVPHRSTPDVLTALLRDDVQVMVESYAALKSQIDDGRVRALASSGESRSPGLPEVATLRESGIAATVVGWNALVAPAQTPAEVVAVLHRHLAAVVAMPDVRERLAALGTEAKASTPEELGARLVADIAMWAEVIRRAGLEPR
jgi:tripartite-type tricarboxylate transporter receptor subunit TctC